MGIHLERFMGGGVRALRGPFHKRPCDSPPCPPLERAGSPTLTRMAFSTPRKTTNEMKVEMLAQRWMFLEHLVESFPFNCLLIWGAVFPKWFQRALNRRGFPVFPGYDRAPRPGHEPTSHQSTVH